MRKKDFHKQEAIIAAAIQVVNQIGFAAASVAKIAKEAEVSPATIYIYYENKEELLKSTYIEIKRRMGEEICRNINDTISIKENLKNIWKSGLGFISENREAFLYAEQFSNSAYSELVDHSELDQYFAPLKKMIDEAIDKKIIKEAPFELITAFTFFPMMFISNKKMCRTIEVNEKITELSFEMAWDSIKR